MHLYNPFRIIRELRRDLAHLEGRVMEMREQLDEAETRAFHRASEHNFHRLRVAEERERAARDELWKIANLTAPVGLVIDPQFFSKQST